jgi:hypothetical protein
MMRAMLTLGLLVGVVGLCQGEDKTDVKGKAATISKMDSVKKTVSVKTKDTEGKETETTFPLGEDMRYLDSTGKVVLVDVFQVGHEVMIIAEDGKLKELRQTAVKKPGIGEKK